MNKIAILPLFLLLFFNSKAQDKIISVNRDTIFCKIVSISNDRILYEQKNNDGSVTGKFIQLAQVSEYSNSHPLDKKSKMRNQETPNPRNTAESSLCLSLGAGGSTMPWYLDHSQSSSTPDYYNKLKTGFHINASAHYLINDFLGLGVEYSFFKSSTHGNMLNEYASTVFLVGTEKCRQYINYLGASFLFQQHLDTHKKIILRESISAGVMFLRFEDQSIYPIIDQSNYSDYSTNMLITGNSFSGKLGLTIEYRLCKAISVGLGGNFIWCLLEKASIEAKGSNDYDNYSYDDQKLSKSMKLSRIDYSFVLRYSL